MKKKKAIAALTVAGLMALQVPMTAFASIDAEWVVQPDVLEHAAIDTTKSAGVIIFNDNVTATVTGDVKVTHSSAERDAVGVQNDSESGTVKVLGDIKIEKTNTEGDAACAGILAFGGTTEARNISATGKEKVYGVLVDGNSSNATVIADGNITAESKAVTGDVKAYGIHVMTPGEDVTVKADKVTVKNSASNGAAIGISAQTMDFVTNTDISIECNGIELGSASFASWGVLSYVEGTSNSNDIRVNGDITGAKQVGVYLVNDDGTNSVIVDGNVESTGIGSLIATDGGQTALAVNGTLSGDQCAVYVECAQIDDGSISVYGLKTSETGKLANDESVLAKVNYIVHGSDGSADYKNMTFDPSQVSTVTVNGKTYYTAKEGTITVTVGSGYALKSTQGISGSGSTYTVTIPQGGFVTLEAILTAVESSAEEQKPFTTGSVGAPVTDGVWNMAPNGTWTYRTNGLFRNTWAYIGNPYANDGQAKEGWFYFDKNGIMLTGWQEINGKWYYFNAEKDGTQGMLLTNTATPDGRRVGADGALIQ